MARRTAHAAKRKSATGKPKQKRKWPPMHGVRLVERTSGQQLERIYATAAKCGMGDKHASEFAIYMNQGLGRGRRPPMQEAVKRFKGKIAKKNIVEFFESISY